MKSRIVSCSLAFAVCCSCNVLVGQVDYTTKTLSYDNITTTNVNQVVAESGGITEKEIEFGDIDNDGDMDIAIAAAFSDFDERKNKLYRNDNGVLNEVTLDLIPEFAGIASSPNGDVGRSVFLRDFDDDGWLDIVLICDRNTSGFGGDNKFFRSNAGASFSLIAGKFTSGSGQLVGSACNGCSADFDGNGLPDIMLANYPGNTQDEVALNGIGGDAAGDFTDVSSTNMPQEPGDVPRGYAVHAETADLNGDGKLDLMIANTPSDDSYIYYNNLNNAGSGDGDFRYSGSTQLIPDTNTAGISENALVPGDFNGDDRMDIYYGNYYGGNGDALLINMGNNASGQVNWDVQPFFTSTMTGQTYKIDVVDLDLDGKLDLVVMSAARRPYIYRNTSANGEVTFVEWTTAAFGNGQRGWHANAEDLTGNGRPDIFVGANNNDFLYENVDSQLLSLDDSPVLPAFHNQNPVAMEGSVAGGESVDIITTSVPNNARVSVLLRSNGDYSVRALGTSGELDSSDRSGDGVEEFMQFTHTGGTLSFEVTNEGKGGVLLGDVDGNGSVELADIPGFVALLTDGGFVAEADMNGDGSVTLADIPLFVDALSNGGGEPVADDFVLEVLSRS